MVWKEQLTQYFMGKVPALWKILEWAEKHDKEKVTDSKFCVAVGRFVSQAQQEHLQSQMWGFLSTCVTGAAAVFFKKALKLNGLDAWRVIVRMIDSGADHQLERLRDEVRAINKKPIKDLEHVATGIAEYEAKILESKEA